MMKTLKINASGLSIEQKKRIADSLTKATIRIGDGDFLIEGVLSMPSMLAICCRLLDMACEADGGEAIEIFKRAWNHNNSRGDRLRLYTEKDIRDIKTTMDIYAEATEEKKQESFERLAATLNVF